MTAAIERFRPLMMLVTFGFLGAAFYMAYRPGQSKASGIHRSRIMSFNKLLLWAVTVIAVVFLFFPQAITGWFASPDGFTADMQRTVITVEGMT